MPMFRIRASLDFAPWIRINVWYLANADPDPAYLKCLPFYYVQIKNKFGNAYFYYSISKHCLEIL